MPTIEPTFVPTPTPIPTYSYYWYRGEWSSCSLSCGNGSQERTIICFRSDSTIADDSYCPAPKPVTSQECNTQACPPPTPGPTPLPYSPPVILPVLLNVTWSDDNSDDIIGPYDLLIFTFNKPMRIETLNEMSVINVRLARHGNAFGSTGASCAWSIGDTILTVVLGTDCSQTLTYYCFDPTSDVKDKEGNADTTYPCVPIPQ